MRVQRGRPRRRDTAAGAAVLPYVKAIVGEWSLTVMRIGDEGTGPLLQPPLQEAGNEPEGTQTLLLVGAAVTLVA
jgi:hypothetical protein